MNEKLIILLGVVAILAIIIVILKLCTKFRNKVYKLFLIEEQEILEGEDKMNFVVENIYALIPYPISLFVNEMALRWLLQAMFNVVEDFLNDGKINRNIGESEEN